MKVRSDDLPYPVTEPNYRLDFTNNTWLGLVNLFQTYEGLDDVQDVQVETRAVRELLVDGTGSDEKTA